MNGDRQRSAILAALDDAMDGLDTPALAAAIGLHPNTVRWHLEVLRNEGLIRSAPEHTKLRGRPRVLHRLTADGAARGRDEYRLLATMLAAAAAAGDDSMTRVYATGVDWGHALHAAEPSSGVAELLDHHGFAATDRGDRIEMRRCPFYALAVSSPRVICTLHCGIIDGAFAAVSTGLRVERLDAFVEPTLCVARLTV